MTARPLPARGAPDVAVVCNGASCRGADRKKLCVLLQLEGIEVVPAKCLGVCDGPVAVLLGRKPMVVSEVDSPKARARLHKALANGDEKAIKRNLVGGSKREKALKRSRRAL